MAFAPCNIDSTHVKSKLRRFDMTWAAKIETTVISILAAPDLEECFVVCHVVNAGEYLARFDCWVGGGFVLVSRLSVQSCICFVDRSPLLVLRAWPLIVSSDSGKCLVTASVVRPGHDANCLFFTTFIQVGFVGKPAEAWRNRTNSGCFFNS